MKLQRNITSFFTFHSLNCFYKNSEITKKYYFFILYSLDRLFQNSEITMKYYFSFYISFIKFLVSKQLIFQKNITFFSIFHLLDFLFWNSEITKQCYFLYSIYWIYKVTLYYIILLVKLQKNNTFLLFHSTDCSFRNSKTANLH